MKWRERENELDDGSRRAQKVRRRPGHGMGPGPKGSAGGTHRSKKEVILRNSQNTEGRCVQRS